MAAQRGNLPRLLLSPGTRRAAALHQQMALSKLKRIPQPRQGAGAVCGQGYDLAAAVVAPTVGSGVLDHALVGDALPAPTFEESVFVDQLPAHRLVLPCLVLLA
jgi:hypothetical protein